MNTIFGCLSVIAIGVIVVVEIYYWFIYFPRAWRDESNREINDIKHAVSLLKGNDHE